MKKEGVIGLDTVLTTEQARQAFLACETKMRDVSTLYQLNERDPLSVLSQRALSRRIFEAQFVPEESQFAGLGLTIGPESYEELMWFFDTTKGADVDFLAMRMRQARPELRNVQSIEAESFVGLVEQSMSTLLNLHTHVDISDSTKKENLQLLATQFKQQLAAEYNKLFIQETSAK